MLCVLGIAALKTSLTNKITFEPENEHNMSPLSYDVLDGMRMASLIYKKTTTLLTSNTNCFVFIWTCDSFVFI